MKLLSGKGLKFIARINPKGILITFENGNTLLIAWCRWRGAISILCQRYAEKEQCVRVGAVKGPGEKNTIEWIAQQACGGSQLMTAPWIVAILYYLGIVEICKKRPLHVKLTSKGKEVICPLISQKEDQVFIKKISSVLKKIEAFDYNILIK